MRWPIGSSGSSVCSGMAPFLNSHASRRSIALRYFEGNLLTVASKSGGERVGGNTDADSSGGDADATAWADFAILARLRYGRGGLQSAATSSGSTKHVQRQRDPSIQWRIKS